MKRYMHGELAPDAPKRPNDPLQIDPNSKVNQGATSGDGNDKKGKEKLYGQIDLLKKKID